MGMIGSLFAMLFGSGRNVIKETAEIFRPNAEKEAQRYQAKAIDFQKDAALLLSQAQKVAENIRKLRTSATPNIVNHDVVEGDRNPGVEEWQENQ